MPEKASEPPILQERRALALLAIAPLMTVANAAISPALPGLEARFASDPYAEILTRMLVPAPSLAVILLGPLSGLWVDRHGRLKLLLVGLGLFAATGSAGLFLPDLRWIFASRLALGVAVAMVMTAAGALSGDFFTGGRRTAFMGLQISARNFGALAFILPAGWLAAVSPELAFAVYLVGAPTLLFAWLALRREPGPHAGSASRIGSDEEARANWRPLILALAALQMLTTLLFFLTPTQTPFFLDALGYDSARMTGATLGTVMFCGGVAALSHNRITRACGFGGAYAVGYALMSTGFAVLPLGREPLAIFASAAAIGAGFAIVMPNFNTIALNLAPAARRGFAIGIVTTALYLGQVVSPLLSNPSIAAFGFERTYYAAAGLLGALSLICALYAAASARASRARPMVETDTAPRRIR